MKLKELRELLDTLAATLEGRDLSLVVPCGEGEAEELIDVVWRTGFMPVLQESAYESDEVVVKDKINHGDTGPSRN